jgi:IMP cyclohydrolase
MQEKWPQLSQFVYPGRFLILGRTDNGYYAVYGVTARSEASRAKRYIFDRATNKIKVEATDFEAMSKGNLDLLSYNAVHLYNDGIILGNGQQTDLVKTDDSAVGSLVSSLHSETFEPDKYRTPRITAMLLNNNSKVTTALYLIKANGGVDRASDSETEQPHHEAFDLDLKPWQAYFISTYSGENIKPTPSFNTDPILIDINFQNVEEAAQQVYDYFAPTEDEQDLRVSVMAIETDLQLGEKSIAIINYTK